MGIDERDYYYAPKQFRNQKYPKFQSEHEDEYWRKLADKQAFNRKAIFICVIVAVPLVWIFGGTINNYWKNLARPRLQATSTLQFPKSGTTIQYQRSTGANARFTVISGEGKTEDCIVKLETWEEGLPVIEIFVRAGEQAETQTVPLGNYRVKHTCGNQWYGRSEMFGKNARTSIGVQPLQFWQSGNTTHGNTLTLTKKINGNFKTNDSYFNKF